MRDASPVIRFARELADGMDLQYSLYNDGTDSYSFETDGKRNAVVRAGSERGVLYAMYDILGGKASGTAKPAFSIRGLNLCESMARHSTEEMQGLIDRMGRWRMNVLIIHSQYGFVLHRDLIERECARRGIELIHYTYYNLAFCSGIPPAHFAKDRDGRPKPPGRKLDCSGRLCAGDTEALRLYEQGVAGYLSAHPEYEHMLFATADGYNYCECPNCRDKGPIAQWEPFFNTFFDLSSDRKREMLVYVNRFRVPGDLSRIRQLDRVMFDTHLRHRRTPLGTGAAPGKASGATPGATAGNPEAAVDPEAAGLTINRYLLDRLSDWRNAYPGTLYVFENLMIHALYGMPWPNLPVYLQDIRTFKRLGIDGVVYEAFGTSISFFSRIFDTLSVALWNPEVSYRPTEFESVYLGDPENGPDWPGNEFWDRYNRNEPGIEYARFIAEFRADGSAENAAVLVGHLISRTDRDACDWLFTCFDCLCRIHKRVRPLKAGNSVEHDFLESEKLWDFMERVDNPRETTAAVIESLYRRNFCPSIGNVLYKL